MSRPAPGRLELVRDLLNTVSVDRGTDELADVAGYRDWLRRGGLPVAGGPADRRQTVALRDALRTLVAAHGDAVPLDGPAVSDARAALGDAALRLGVDETGTPVLVPAMNEPGSVARATILGLVVEATFAGTWARLKLCRRPTCRWAFYDASPARAAVWCTMSVCGARHKSRTYRRRQTAPT